MFVSETSPTFRVQQRSLLSECELYPRGRRCCCVLGWGPGNYSQQGGSSGNNVQAHPPAGVDLNHGECAHAHTEALRSVAAQHWFGQSRGWDWPKQALDCSSPARTGPEEKSTPALHLHPPPQNASASPQPAPTGQIEGQHWIHTHLVKALGVGPRGLIFSLPLTCY